jgi:type 1 glutamine amidotransferase
MKALITRGGWDGHQPVETSEVFRDILVREGFDVEIVETLDCFLDAESLKTFDLVVPIWTMSSISKEQTDGILAAVESGVGIAGNHGGMCDAFRQDVRWQFMTGGQWVAHPGNSGVTYEINIRKSAASPIVCGIHDFKITSEQYYVHVDPVNNVLATTRFPVYDGPHAANGVVDVPVVWTKRWGKGRVFYNSLGHHADAFDIPEARELMRRGFLWAARGRTM